MNELQLKLYDMFKFFHQLCEENDLEYYMLGGTFLGAIRHKGFIPWDDDIDVGMPRDSYEKLRKILYNEKNDRYSLLSTGHGKNKGDFAYRKLVDNTTTLVENINEHRITGIYIDIFPLDGAPQYELLRKIRFGYSKLFSYLLWFNSSDKQNNRKIVKKASKLLDNRKIYRYINKFIGKMDFNTSPFVGNYLGNWGYKEIFEKSIIGEPKLYKFEDSYFFGPSNFEVYLTQMYGDYNVLPKVSERGNHHTYEHIDLNKSYLDTEH